MTLRETLRKITSRHYDKSDPVGGYTFVFFEFIELIYEMSQDFFNTSSLSASAKFQEFVSEIKTNI